jgi:hypothetical protein
MRIKAENEKVTGPATKLPAGCGISSRHLHLLDANIMFALGMG